MDVFLLGIFDLLDRLGIPPTTIIVVFIGILLALNILPTLMVLFTNWQYSLRHRPSTSTQVQAYQEVCTNKMTLDDSPAESPPGWGRILYTDGRMELFQGDIPIAMADDERTEEILKLRLALAEAKAMSEMLSGDSVARIKGRVHSWHGGIVNLAVVDSGEAFQRIGIKVLNADDRRVLQVGMVVHMVTTFHEGRLVLKEILQAESSTAPMPELAESPKMGRIPDWFNSRAKNDKRRMLKASDGSASVSEVRLHIVWACKRRGSWLTKAMVDRLKALTAEVTKERRLGELLAVNVGGKDENQRDFVGDHVHIAIWTYNTHSPSQVVGIIKGYVSKHLRQEFPELKGHDQAALFQRGFYAGTIGADLGTVMDYINGQSKTVKGDDSDEGGDGDAE